MPVAHRDGADRTASDAGEGSVQPGTATLATGKTHALDFMVLAMGVRPNPIFKEAGLATGPDGGLRVNAFLQSVDHPEMFGGGDCIHFENQPLDKVGVYAVRQNPVLYHNLMAALDGAPLQPFDPGGDYLLIFDVVASCSTRADRFRDSM